MPVKPGRYTASHSGPLTVFLIGMRINQFWRVDKWLPVARAMPSMLRELAADADSGFLGSETVLQGFRTILVIQYWDGFANLERYARAADMRHRPAWTAFNKSIGDDGTVGIFHETYTVAPGGSETVYNNMPIWGLGQVAGVEPATGTLKTARDRLTRSNPTP